MLADCERHMRPTAPSHDAFAAAWGADQPPPAMKATDDSNVEAALRAVSAVAAHYRGESEPNRRVAAQWLLALAQRLRDNLQLYGRTRR